MMKKRYNIKEDRKKVLSKAKAIKANQTETGKPADPVELDPAKQGIQNTSLTN